MSTFLISLPIFLIVLSGWLLRKFKIVTDDWVHILNVFAYYVSLPALIVASFWEINFLSKESWNIIFLSLLTLGLFSLAVFILLHFIQINKNLKTAIFLTATVGNTIYMGFPLVELGFGKESISTGALIGVIYLVIPILISIFIIRYWHNKEHNVAKEVLAFIKNPLMISVFAGVILSFLKIASIDNFLIFSVKKSISMLGATASPIALFTLGAFLYGRFLKKDLGLAFFVSFLKIICFPIIVFITIFYFFKPESSQILILLSSMPVAVTTFVIAEKFNLNKELVGNSLFISTVLSFIVIPIIFYFIQ
ncbi:MAG: AEC family transporter [Patescibacteria group bacterium]